MSVESRVESLTSRRLRSGANHERGLGFFGLLFWLAFLGGIYAGVSYLPVLSDDYTLKQVARGVCNDFLARNATTNEHVVDLFHRRVAGEKLDWLKPQVEPELDEQGWMYAKLTVSYTRTWKLLWTKKTFARPMKWTMKSER
jgi:hypothetical protein